MSGFADSTPTWFGAAFLAQDWILAIGGFLWVNLVVIAGVLLAGLTILNMFVERKKPAAIFAWGIVVILMPFIGAPLYLIFGGRKSRRLVRIKKRLDRLVHEVRAEGKPDAPDRDTTVGSPVRSAQPPVMPGNRVDLFGDGVSGYHALMTAIDDARESIYILTYILSDDETGRVIVDRLVQRARDGIEVKLLLDGLGSRRALRGLTRPLRQAGGAVAGFIPILALRRRTSANLRNHRKIAIFDGDYAITGGQNLDARFLAAEESDTLFKDYNLGIRGPAVQEFTEIFVQDWVFATNSDPRAFARNLRHEPARAGNTELCVISSGPETPTDAIWERFLSLVQECQQRLTIVTPYFIPDDVLYQSLRVKALAGKQVQLILPAISNHPLADLARRHFVRDLHEVGCDIRLYTRRMNHGKLMIVDDRIAIAGTANMDMRSFFLNFELAVTTETEETLNVFKTWIHRLEPDCIPFAESERATPKQSRLLLEHFAYLISPLL
ncbi:MAG: phospholipase D-like domain-containing protein [Opitutales bacterium]